MTISMDWILVGWTLILLTCAPCGADLIADTVSELNERTRALSDSDPLPEASLDLSVPQSPAFAVLGLTPESVVRPTSPTAFATSVLSGADPRGNIQTGLALASAPYLLFKGNDITLAQYRDPRNYGLRLASRTQFSFATAKGISETDQATRLALGLTVTLFDRGDPRLDDELLACFEERIGGVHDDAVQLLRDLAPLAATGSPELPIRLEKGITRLEERAKKQAEACRQEARMRNWNASAWTVGFAPTWTAPDGNVNNLDASGIGLWTSVGYGFEDIPGLEDSAQFVLHARYRSGELTSDPSSEGSFFEQDAMTIAGQIRLAGFSFRDTKGGPPDLNLLLEAAYVEEDRTDRPDENLLRYTLGLDYRIAEDLYLDFSVGTEDGREHEDNSSFGMLGLRWAFRDKPTRNVN